MQSERAQPRRQRRSAAAISEVCKSARSATQPCWNSPRAISNIAMSLARLAQDDNGSRRAGLWWPGAGGTGRDLESVGLRLIVFDGVDAVSRRAIRASGPLPGEAV